MGISQILGATIGPYKTQLLKQHASIQRGYRTHRHEFDSLQNNQRTCFILGTANYGNLGDLAIAEAQYNFIKDNFDGNVVEIPTGKLWEYKRCIQEFADPQRDVICLQGGGNMGDLYSIYEYERCFVMRMFPNMKIIVMPQTISYSNPQSKLARYAQSTYKNHPNLHLFAREKVSFAAMRQYFPEASVALVPDIVLSFNVNTLLDKTPTERAGAVIVLRDDVEKNLNADERGFIDKAIRNVISAPISTTDTVIDTDHEIGITERRGLLSKKLQQFRNAQIIITDRLHGMVFAALTGTPAIVFNNNNHKVRGVYEWIQDLPYITFIQSTKEFPDALKQLTNYDYSKNVYPLKDIYVKFAPPSEDSTGITDI
jgi:pyruvyl transferase EpsI